VDHIAVFDASGNLKDSVSATLTDSGNVVNLSIGAGKSIRVNDASYTGFNTTGFPYADPSNGIIFSVNAITKAAFYPTGLDVFSNPIKNVQDPTNPQDAATKNYVDGKSTPNAITALTGAVTATGPGSVTATIAANAISVSNIAQANAYTIMGNFTSSVANLANNTLTTFNSMLQTLYGIYTDVTNKIFNIGSPRTTTGRLNVETNDPSVVGVTIRATATLASPDTFSGLVQWIQASSLDGTHTDGQAVGSITDKSSNRTVFSGSPYPILKKSIINGVSVMRFGGVGSLVGTITNANVFSAVGMTAFVVMFENTGSVFNNAWSQVDDIDLQGINTAAGYQIGLGWQRPPRLEGGTQGTGLNVWHIYSYTKDSTSNQNVLVDNVSKNSGGGFTNWPSLAGTSTAYIGNWGPSPTYYLTGDIAEIIIYNRKLTTTEYDAVYNWVATRYAFPTTGGIPQTADLLQTQDDSGNVLSKFDAGGQFVPGSTMRTTAGPSGTLWADPSDSYRIKYVP
jgi:hypothetical protein